MWYSPPLKLGESGTPVTRELGLLAVEIHPSGAVRRETPGAALGRNSSSGIDSVPTAGSVESPADVRHQGVPGNVVPVS